MYDRKVKNLGIWIMYLRKSRQDNPDETVEEVLAKHEAQLQEHAVRELGGRIAEENIYREVISGESIDEREEIKKVLGRIEDPAVIGVLVIEPQRLSRGDLEDCGRLINAFRFTHTQVCTPIMTYDLENKMDRKFFQDELLRGRDYLEYTKEILFRGRVASAKRGCYIGKTTPFGYNKIKIGKDPTLEPSENAALVRSMYEWYVYEEMTPGAIAKRLNALNIPSPAGGTWEKRTISFILKNPLYIGKVLFNKRKRTPVLEDGEVVMKRLPQPTEDIIIAEGKHPAIVDIALWEAAQERFEKNVHAQPKPKRETPHPLCGMVACSCCGHNMSFHPYKQTDDRFECRARPRCYRSVKQSFLMEAVIFSLEHSQLPELEHKLESGNEIKIQRQTLDKLEKQMQEYRIQEDKQYELLETGKYTLELFEHRYTELRQKMDLCQKQIIEAREKMPKNIDFSERVDTLKKAIELLKDPNATAVEKSHMLKRIIKKVYYTGQKSDGWGQKGFKHEENKFSIEVTLVI